MESEPAVPSFNMLPIAGHSIVRCSSTRRCAQKKLPELRRQTKRSLLPFITNKRWRKQVARDAMCHVRIYYQANQNQSGHPPSTTQFDTNPTQSHAIGHGNAIDPTRTAIQQRGTKEREQLGGDQCSTWFPGARRSWIGEVMGEERDAECRRGGARAPDRARGEVDEGARTAAGPGSYSSAVSACVNRAGGFRGVGSAPLGVGQWHECARAVGAPVPGARGGVAPSCTTRPPSWARLRWGESVGRARLCAWTEPDLAQKQSVEVIFFKMWTRDFLIMSRRWKV